MNPSHLHSIYQTRGCHVSQCDVTNRFEVDLFGSAQHVRFCTLLALRKKVNDVELLPMLDGSAPDIEVFSFGCLDRVFAFTIHEVLEMKDLLEGTFAMLELNSILHAQLERIS